MLPKKEKILKLLEKYFKKHQEIHFPASFLHTKNKAILKLEKLVKIENKILKKLKLYHDEKSLQILYRFVKSPSLLQKSDLLSCFQQLLRRMQETNNPFFPL